jgi:hypothetical protein
MARMVNETVATTMRETGVDRSAFEGVGIGAPGPLDRAAGVVLVAPNLGWHNVPLRDRMTALTGLPAALDNDANCATYGEWWIGAAKGGRNVIGVTIGTGIGGGLILDGRPYHGSSDVAGEIGHTTIDQTGRRCGCGNYGCLEAYASGTAIAERAREALTLDGASVLRELVDGDISKITAATVYAAANQGDAIATDVVRDTARFLGNWCAERAGRGAARRWGRAAPPLSAPFTFVRHTQQTGLRSSPQPGLPKPCPHPHPESKPPKTAKTRCAKVLQGGQRGHAPGVGAAGQPAARPARLVTGNPSSLAALERHAAPACSSSCPGVPACPECSAAADLKLLS